MSEEECPPLKWPRWEWSDKWLYGPPTLLGVVGFFPPYFVGVASNVWLIVGIVLVSSVLTIPTVIWGWHACVVLIARTRRYPYAATYAKEQNRKLLEANRRLSETMPLGYSGLSPVERTDLPYAAPASLSLSSSKSAGLR